MSAEPRRNVFSRLYRGETAFNFIGRRNQWFVVSAVVILVGLLSLATRGLNLGIEFKGGTSWEVPANGKSVADARSALHGTIPDATIQTVGSGGKTDLRVQAKATTQTTTNAVTTTLAHLTKSTTDKVDVTSVGPTWGHEITNKAERALVVFLVAIFFFIWFRFSEWKMSVAALIALVHDILVTVGVYALFGFPVTPATVVAFLTILGYSLYDTVVVFDKVDENTKGLASSGRMTYSDTVNLSMNQVLMRSINTSLVAILPVFSILMIGSQLLGATTLREFGLALFVGLVTGAYSSIFIASPALAVLKEREPRYATIRQRIESRGAAGALLTPAAAAAASGASRGGGARRQVDDLVVDDGDGGLRPAITPGVASRAGGAGSGAAGSNRPARRSGSSGPVGPPRARPTGSRPAPRGRKKGKRR